MRAFVIPTPNMDAPKPTANSLVPLRATAPDRCTRLYGCVPAGTTYSQGAHQPQERQVCPASVQLTSMRLYMRVSPFAGGKRQGSAMIVRTAFSWVIMHWCLTNYSQDVQAQERRLVPGALVPSQSGGL